jgi:HPt (histidine-containing phosphotransfer) domain-containing protein/HAMP domain-containing protein
MSPSTEHPVRAPRRRLRAKLVRTAIGTLSLVTAVLILTVALLHVRSSRGTLRVVESDIRERITRKGRSLVSNQARALRILVADNAFGDVRSLVEATVNDDEELAFGVFLGRNFVPWAYTAPTTRAGLVDRDAVQELKLDRSLVRDGSVRADEKFLFGQGVFQFSSPVRTDAGAPLGTIIYGVWAARLTQALNRARQDSRRELLMSVIILSLLTLTSVMVGWVLVRRAAARITRPLAELTKATTALAGGNRKLQVSLQSDDELEDLGRAFNQMVSELNESYERLEGLNHTLEDRVDQRTRELAHRNQELAHRNRDLRLVLDTVNEGLLTVDRDGALAQEHSAVIDRWFGAYSGPTLFVDYLLRLNENFARLFKLALEALVEDFLPFEVNLKQMPSELRYDEQEFRFSYLPIFEEKRFAGLLVTVNDITAELALAQHEAEQRELVALFEGLMRDRPVFLSFFDEASGLVERITSGQSSAATLQRLVHTLKGNASLVDLSLVSQICHEIEDELEQAQSVRPNGKIAVLRHRWQALRDSLQTFVGKRGREVVEVDLQDIQGLTHEVLHGSSPEQIAARLSNWRSARAGDLFARLAEHATSLATRLGRGSLIVEIDSDGVRIDPRRWAGLWTELIHLVRNAIDHGLEPMAERGALGKSSGPHLRLGAYLRPEGFVVEVEDDGRGIDWEAIRRAARRRGLSADTEEQLLAALLLGGVSTRADVTTTSGRGVGMAALHRRVQELGGTITVSTHAGAGTCWRLCFPGSSLEPHEGLRAQNASSEPDHRSVGLA